MSSMSRVSLALRYNIYDEPSRLDPYKKHKSELYWARYIATCWTGESRVLMSDGTEQRIDQIQPGDYVSSPFIPVGGDVCLSSFCATLARCLLCVAQQSSKLPPSVESDNAQQVL